MGVFISGAVVLLSNQPKLTKMAVENARLSHVSFSYLGSVRWQHFLTPHLPGELTLC